jgi:hypothetical protein
MNLKGKASPILIIVSVVVLAAFIYGVYRISFAPKPHDVSRENMPAYVKNSQAAQAGRAPGGGGPAAPPGGAPSYGGGSAGGGSPYGGAPGGGATSGGPPSFARPGGVPSTSYGR